MEKTVFERFYCFKTEATPLFKVRLLGRSNVGLMRVKLLDCEFAQTCPYKGSVDCRLTRCDGELETAYSCH